MFEALKEKGFQVQPLHHAEAILAHDLQEAVGELTEALGSIQIPVEELVRSGGGEAELTQRMREHFNKLGWNKHKFKIETSIDNVPSQSLSHEIDHVRKLKGGTLAFEIEWNNKDPFFDRDLENFKRLHAEGAISVGGIVTRGTSLQDGLRDSIEAFAVKAAITDVSHLEKYYHPTQRQISNCERRAAAMGNFARAWADVFVSDKFGESTTHWRKLEQRVERKVGNPCPLVLIGIPASVLRL